MAAPNPECPSFTAWPGVAAHHPGTSSASRGEVSMLSQPWTKGLLSILPPELADVARDIALTPKPTRDPRPLAVVSKGISLRGLRKLRQTLREFFGEQRYATISTDGVNTEWVKVVTRKYKCRVAEDPALVAREDVGVPQYFISHAWKNGFDLLLRGVESYLASADEGTRVWIDIIAVNQHPDSGVQAADVGAFKDVVHACSGGTLVVLDMGNCNPATRAWCIYEWAHTLGFHGPDGLHLHASVKERTVLVSSLDVRKAECYMPADKEMILADVRATAGSEAAFNQRLKLQLLLQPLSYTVDLRQLRRGATATATAAAGAGPTAWDWGPIKAWLDEGDELGAGRQDGRDEGDGDDDEDEEGEVEEGSNAATLAEKEERRKAAGASPCLCVLGGPGEGKSTLVAALLQDAQLGRRVHGFHLCKFSDQRRREPKRVLESLLFSMAMRLPEMRKGLLTMRPEHLAAIPDSVTQWGSGVDMMLMQLFAADRAKQLVVLVDALDEADAAPAAPQQQQQQQHGEDSSASGAPAPSSSSNDGTNGGSGGGGGGGGGVNAVFQLITTKLRSYFIRGRIRFIVTVRPDGLGGNARAALNSAFGAGRVVYVTPQQLQQPATMEAAAPSSVAAKSSHGGGVLLFNRVAKDCLGLASDAAASAALLGGAAGRAPGLSDLYSLYGRVFQSGMSKLPAREREAVSELLNVLLVAAEPLPQVVLEAMGLGGAVEKLPGYGVLFYVDEHHLHMLHATLADWMRSSGGGGSGGGDGGGGVGVAAAAAGTAGGGGHVLLARHLLQSVRAGSLLPYGLRYLAHHLVAVANQAASSGSSTSSGGGRVAATAAAAAAALEAEAVAGLEELMGSYSYLAEVCRQGFAHRFMSDLLQLLRPSARLEDCQRWLVTAQHDLVNARSRRDVLATALQCPAGTTVFQHAKQATAATAAAAGPAVADAGRGPAEGAAAGSGGQAGGGGGGQASWALSCTLGQIMDWPAARLRLKHEDWIMDVDVSPDGRLIALSGRGETQAGGRTVLLFNALTGALIKPLTEREDTCKWCVRFSPDGALLAAAGSDKTVHLWSVASGQCVAKFEVDTSSLADSHRGKEVHDLDWHPDGSTLATADGAYIYLWQRQRQRQEEGMEQRQGQGQPGTKKPKRGKRRAWDIVHSVSTGSDPKAARTSLDSTVWALRYSPTGQYLAAGSGPRVLIFSSATLEPVAEVKLDISSAATLSFGKGTVMGLSYSPDSWLLASARSDRLQVWDVSNPATPTLVAEPQVHPRTAFKCVGFSPNGSMLAVGGGTGGEHGIIHLLDTSTWAVLAQITKEHKSGVDGLCWSRDGRYLVSCSIDRTAVQWEVARLLHSSKPQGHTSPLTCLAWAPDNKALASGASDHTVRIWECGDDGRCLAVLPLRQGVEKERGPASVVSLAWSADGSTLAAASSFLRGTDWRLATAVEVWDVPSQSRLFLIQPTETTFSVRSSSISFTEPCVKMLLRFVEPKGADSGSSGGGGGDGGGAAGTLQGVCYVLLSPDQWRLTDVLFTWDAASGKELSRKVLVSSPDDGYRLGQDPRIGHCDWSPGGGNDMVAVGGNKLELWDGEATASHAHLQLDTCTELWRASWACDGTAIAAVLSYDDDMDYGGHAAKEILPPKQICVWDAQYLKAFKPKNSYDEPKAKIKIVTQAEVWDAVFSPTDAGTLASVSEDGTLRLWDLRQSKSAGSDSDGEHIDNDGENCIAFRVGTKPLLALAWSPNGRMVACGGDERTIAVFSQD